MNLHGITSCGWKLSDGGLNIDWGSAHSVIQVQHRVLLLTNGYKCKSLDVDRPCGCKK